MKQKEKYDLNKNYYYLTYYNNNIFITRYYTFYDSRLSEDELFYMYIVFSITCDDYIESPIIGNNFEVLENLGSDYKLPEQNDKNEQNKLKIIVNQKYPEYTI